MHVKACINLPTKSKRLHNCVFFFCIRMGEPLCPWHRYVPQCGILAIWCKHLLYLSIWDTQRADCPLWVGNSLFSRLSIWLVNFLSATWYCLTDYETGQYDLDHDRVRDMTKVFVLEGLTFLIREDGIPEPEWQPICARHVQIGYVTILVSQIFPTSQQWAFHISQ